MPVYTHLNGKLWYTSGSFDFTATTPENLIVVPKVAGKHIAVYQMSIMVADVTALGEDITLQDEAGNILGTPVETSVNSQGNMVAAFNVDPGEFGQGLIVASPVSENPNEDLLLVPSASAATGKYFGFGAYISLPS